MSRKVSDLFLLRARRVETERRLEQRHREEADFLLKQQMLQQRAIQQMQREKQLQEYAETQTKIKEAKEKERLKTEQQVADSTALFAVILGQMSFQSQSEWDHAFDCFFKKIESILPKIGVERLNEVESFFLEHYNRMLKDYKKKDLASLRNYMSNSYAQARQEYFRQILQGRGSSLEGWTYLF